MSKKKKFGNPAKEAARKAEIKNMFDKVIDRNGCSIIVPRDGNSELAKKYMKIVRDSMKIYGLDNCLYSEGDVQSVTRNDMTTTITYKNHNCKSDPVKVFTTLSSNFKKIEDGIDAVNFSSWDNFKKNLLPSFNGPDKACFIGKQLENITIGYMFDIPNVKTLS